MNLEAVERAMRAKGFVCPNGEPDWRGLAEALGIAWGTMRNLKSGVKPGRLLRFHITKTLELKEEEVWPDGLAECVAGQ